MFQNALDTFVYGVSKFFNFIATFKIFGNVTILGVLVGFFVLLLIIDNFLLKGQ